ncbi:unnamed protein product [Menidia menidia]|uniref:(Atlantic silverside) hypothetical protein n=1 Tax=Menidia menidia TaxID=238744 RepID=A0A8S4AHV7_9TELE|nr:unnamed protein product [Menidia menidia]
MASSGWDCLFCLTPALLVLLLSLALRRPGARRWTRLAAGAAGRRLWGVFCLVTRLPTPGGEGELTEGSGRDRTPDRPRLVCKATALARHLLQHCPSMAGPALAAWPWGDPHVQTLVALFCGQRGDGVRFSREHLLLKDGGIVALDWASGPARRRWEGRREPPVLLLVPQCWGGTTPHLRMLSQRALRQGFCVVVFHHRGTAGAPLATARLTEFGDPADLQQAVDYVHSRHPSSALVAVSEGSGSGVLLSYLGECGSSTPLLAAAALSPVLLGRLWLERPLPPIYRWGALFHRKLQLRRYGSSLRGVLNVDGALSSSSLRDFEETLFCSSAQLKQGVSTSPGSSLNSGSPSGRGPDPSVVWALGERAYPATDWDGYWGRNEPLRDADEVAVPVLCIRSRDDPLLPPASTLPLPLFRSNPYFLLLLTNRGGHCGFTLDGRGETDQGTRWDEDEEEEEGGHIWSHITVLEYFRVLADFLKEGGRDGVSWRGPTELHGQSGQKTWTSTLAPARRRRATLMRRMRAQETENSTDESEAAGFTWKRSYTR